MSTSDVLAAVVQLTDSEELGAVLSIIDGPDLGSKTVIDAAGNVLAGSFPKDVAKDAYADATELMQAERSQTLKYDGRSIFIESVVPEPVLLIFGAGHIAQPLSVIARQLGFRVVVTDARSTWATVERFPDVDRLVVAWPDSVLADIALDQRTYVVLLSHDRRFEDPVMPAIRAAPVRYVGALGSRRTARERVTRLAAAGWSEDEIARIHAPIGIDIGADQPAEVAVSIAAEMIKVRYGAGTGLSLRGQAGRVHSDQGSASGTV